MWIEVHLLQNFAPSNLNRDDTGSPKDCEFGGYRRARISSQCQKKAIRDAFRERELLDAANRAVRTKRLARTVAERLADGEGDAEAAGAVAENALQVLGFGLAGGDTDYLLFVGADEIDRLVEVCRSHREVLSGLGLATKTRQARKADKDATSKDVKALKEELSAALDGRRAADVALFGRMLADLPDRNREGACQVAHAISTNRMDLEFDYFTAVDDLKPAAEDLGAGMIGTVEFTSACYYRYAAIDVRTLRENLGGDAELAAATARAFLDAAATAIPTGKQHSFAAHNPPSLLLTVARTDAPRSLANAFVRPIKPNGADDLIAGSVAALDGFWYRLAAMFGDGGLRAAALLVDDHYASKAPHLGEARVASLGEAIERVVGAAGLPARAG